MAHKNEAKEEESYEEIENEARSQAQSGIIKIQIIDTG
jgi:hypothetical protein